jgi:hypothetical protein
MAQTMIPRLDGAARRGPHSGLAIGPGRRRPDLMLRATWLLATLAVVWVAVQDVGGYS